MSTDTSRRTPTTALSHHTTDAIYYREKNLVTDILKPGATPDFVAEAAAHILGRDVSDGERRVLNAIMITMMEHGFTPSAIATRSIYMSAPENMQGAVAAGLLAVGSQFVGTVENNARILNQLVALEDDAQRTLAERVVDDHKARKVHMPASATTCTVRRIREPSASWRSGPRTVSPAAMSPPCASCRRWSTSGRAGTSPSTPRGPPPRSSARWACRRADARLFSDRPYGRARGPHRRGAAAPERPLHLGPRRQVDPLRGLTMPDHALVTGGSRNIGGAIAQRLTADGFKVIVVDMVKPEHDALDSFVEVDLSDAAALPGRLANAIAGRTVTRLVNNAGIVAPPPSRTPIRRASTPSRR